MGGNNLKQTRLALVSLLAFTPALPAAAKYHKHGRVASVSGPDSRAENLLKAGMDNLDHREYAAAIGNISKAVSERGTAARYFLLGYAYYQRGFMGGSPESADKQDAIEVVNAYTTAIALDTDLKEISEPYKLYHGLAMAYEALGSNEKAIEGYRKSFMLAPTNAILPLYAARLRLKMGESDKSLANLETALKRAKTTGQETALLRLVKFNPMFSNILQDPDHARLLKQYDPTVTAGVTAPKPGSLIAMRPNIPAANDAYSLRDSVKDTAPAAVQPARSAVDQAVLEAIASANDEFRFRRWTKAIDGYNDALILNQQSGTLSPGQAAFVQERIGTSYNKMGLTTEAVTALQRSVQALPYNSAAHYQLALAYSVSGHYKEAMKALRESFKTAPSNGELRKAMLLAKTDSELEPLRDLPSFAAAISEYSARVQASR